MHLESLGRDVGVAAEAVRDVVRLITAVEPDAAGRTLTKADGSPVTAADFIVQACLSWRLAQHFPDDPLVAEEDSRVLRAAAADAVRPSVVAVAGKMLPPGEADAGKVLAWIDRGSGPCDHRFWTLDPIDGTKGLLRGGQFVVALALLNDGAAQIGVVGCPRLSVTTAPASASTPADSSEHALVAAVEGDAEGGVAIAARGRGAWWMGLHGSHLLHLAVSAESNPARTRAVHSCESRHSDLRELHRVLRTLHSPAPPMLMDGQTKQVVLAAGAAELLMRIPADPRYHEAIWDQAAGALLVEEAGGRVTDLDGLALDFTTGRTLLRNRGLIASNGRCHDAVLEAVRAGRIHG